jgi:hypothetical protein
MRKILGAIGYSAIYCGGVFLLRLFAVRVIGITLDGFDYVTLGIGAAFGYWAGTGFNR